GDASRPRHRVAGGERADAGGDVYRPAGALPPPPVGGSGGQARGGADMTAVLWKEYREQRVIWVTFLLAGLGFVLGIAPLLSTDEGAELLASLVLCWTYGLVCGSMLLAGEREEGTLRFLDSLPGDRWGLWQSKFFAGVVFTLSLAGLYIALLVGT